MVSNIFRAKANELVESALALSKKLGCYESIISGIENGEIFSIEKGYKSKTIAYLEYIIFNFSTREIDSRPCKSLEMQINRRFSQEIHPAKSLRN